MKIKIDHVTRYEYDKKVFLEPHTIRLTPRPENHIQVLHSDLCVKPEPHGRNEILEMAGSRAALVWFNDMTDFLDVRMRTLVEVKPMNPFEFIVYPVTCLRLPMVYPYEWASLLIAYLKVNSEAVDVKNFAEQLAEEAEYECVTFLTRLIKTIYERFDYVVRPSGGPLPPLELLIHKRGACRDFTVFAMEVCRHLGIASRYVSGYYWSDENDEPGELHAWFEVFLPGAGWKGFDPSHGIACDHHHIALCTSADPALTLPVTGTYRGVSQCTMSVDMAIESLAV